MALAVLSSEALSLVSMLVLLVGVPLFVVAVIAVASGYIRFDAERHLEELEEGEGGESFETADAERDDNF
ncbi:hypothetical protein [Natronorubrum daqingense]|uniref:Uncharacterized protein n=1 Tax=Natronorubrum daqingense TaxID=588898 RepID=A0A1N7BXM5_9EURY|nr:hypothetical protein [Natronorubrum daqingense]APX96640.1 hypothetical protein BB347_08435 [Natronorubrum daqingense]SIR56088.1 hypothetical protein SAMN05421809_1406 [Natronorubrum daqingense]